MEQVITQLAVKILFDEEDNYFTREAEIIDIVYDFDKDWFRIFTLERDTD